MSSKDRRDRERDETRDRILDATRDLLVKDGYEAVTMRAVADRIEYTPTAIYHHFKDKVHLVFECCLKDSHFLASEIQRLAGETKDPIERIRRLGHAYAEFGLKHPNHYQLMFMTKLPPIDQSELTKVKGNPDLDAYAALTEAVTAAIKTKRLRSPYNKNVDATAQVLWAAVHGMVSLRIIKVDNGFIDWGEEQEAVKMIIDAVLDGMLKD